MLSITFNFAALVYTKPEEQHWLVKRFEMFEEEPEESWLYQRIFEKGYKKGLEEASERKVCELLRETFIVFLNAQYPILVDLARGQISGINETKRLQEIINKVFYLQTASEIEEYLLSLHDDAAKN